MLGLQVLYSSLYFCNLSFPHLTTTTTKVFFCSFPMTSDASAEPTTRHVPGAQSCCRVRNCHTGCYSINNPYVAGRHASQKKRAASCPLSEILGLPSGSISNENLSLGYNASNGWAIWTLYILPSKFPQNFLIVLSAVCAVNLGIRTVVNFLTCLWTLKCYCSNHNTSEHLHRFQQ